MLNVIVGGTTLVALCLLLYGLGEKDDELFTAGIILLSGALLIHMIV